MFSGNPETLDTDTQKLNLIDMGYSLYSCKCNLDDLDLDTHCSQDI